RRRCGVTVAVVDRRTRDGPSPLRIGGRRRGRVDQDRVVTAHGLVGGPAHRRGIDLAEVEQSGRIEVDCQRGLRAEKGSEVDGGVGLAEPATGGCFGREWGGIVASSVRPCVVHEGTPYYPLSFRRPTTLA